MTTPRSAESLLAESPTRIEGDQEARLVGVDSTGGLRYFRPEDRTIAVDAREEVPESMDVSPDWNAGRQLAENESLGEVIEDIEETVGWDALSDYAKDALGVDDEN